MQQTVQQDAIRVVKKNAIKAALLNVVETAVAIARMDVAILVIEDVPFNVAQLAN